MNDGARTGRFRRRGWRPAEVLLERAEQGVIDDEAAAQELLDLIDPDRVDVQERAGGEGRVRGVTAASNRGEDTASTGAAAAPVDRPA